MHSQVFNLFVFRPRRSGAEHYRLQGEMCTSYAITATCYSLPDDGVLAGLVLGLPLHADHLNAARVQWSGNSYLSDEWKMSIFVHKIDIFVFLYSKFFRT